jgi:hypothetical protein
VSYDSTLLGDKSHQLGRLLQVVITIGCNNQTSAIRIQSTLRLDVFQDCRIVLFLDLLRMSEILLVRGKAPKGDE